MFIYNILIVINNYDNKLAPEWPNRAAYESSS